MTSCPSMLRLFILGVGTAFTNTSPRADDTFTQSPVLMPSFFARGSGISIMGSGTSSFSHGMLRVDEPEHQCSATVDVIRTYGKFSGVPMGWCDSTRGYFSI